MATTQHLEYKSGNGSGIVKVLANKGITWQVQDEETGDIFLVQKKHVTKGPWTETPDEELPPPATGSLAAQMAAAAVAATAPPKGKAKAKAAPAVTDPDLITLKQLCFDLGMEPRIARRKLRKSLGNIGTGSRWEWKLGSTELAAVRKALTAAPAAEADADILAEALDGLYSE